jgi:uncharacterized membrane protein
MALAAAHNALPIALLAVLGGLLIPVLCSTGVDSRDVLFTYLTVLDLGVLAVTMLRRWRALDVLAFVGKWALFAGGMGSSTPRPRCCRRHCGRAVSSWSSC